MHLYNGGVTGLVPISANLPNLGMPMSNTTLNTAGVGALRYDNVSGNSVATINNTTTINMLGTSASGSTQIVGVIDPGLGDAITPPRPKHFTSVDLIGPQNCVENLEYRSNDCPTDRFGISIVFRIGDQPQPLKGTEESGNQVTGSGEEEALALVYVTRDGNGNFTRSAIQYYLDAQ